MDRLRHLAGRVWIWPGDPNPDNIQGAVGVISDPQGSTIIDAGNSPGAAARIQRAIAAARLPPPRWLVYTHHHWDHVWGAVAWRDLEVVGHALTRQLLEVEAERPWSDAYLRAEVEREPKLGPSFRARERAMDTWRDFRVCPPDTVFESKLLLPSGVLLAHVGGLHAPDSIIATDLRSGVRFLGDCFYPPPTHLREESDEPDVDMAAGLVRDDVEWYVDAHSPPWDAKSAEAMIGRG